MQYSEIVEKIHNHESLYKEEISGFQLLMLIQNNEIKTINYHSNIFEINFIPITYTFEPYVLKEENLSRFQDGEKILEHWIHCYDAKKAIYVQIENEYFEIIVDLLESAL